MKVLESIAKISGYNNGSHLIDSTFHPNSLPIVLGISSIAATTAYYFEAIMGINIPVGILIIILFGLELFTGIRASIKEGKGFSSEKFQKGWLKLFIYMVFIICSNLAARYIPNRPFFGFQFNIYDWLHYLFYNFIIIQLFISNLENFMRLGWGNFLPLISQLSNVLKLNQDKAPKKSEHDNDSPSNS
jgi:hypothetical protein